MYYHRWHQMILEWVRCTGGPEIAIASVSDLSDFEVFGKLLETRLPSPSPATPSSRVSSFLSRFYPRMAPRLSCGPLKEEETTLLALVFVYHFLLQFTDAAAQERICRTADEPVQEVFRDYLELALKCMSDDNVHSLTVDDFVGVLRRHDGKDRRPRGFVTPAKRRPSLSALLSSPCAQRQRLVGGTGSQRDLWLVQDQLQDERARRQEAERNLQVERLQVRQLHTRLSEKSAEIESMSETLLKCQTDAAAAERATCAELRGLRDDVKSAESYAAQLTAEMGPLHEQLASVEARLDRALRSSSEWRLAAETAQLAAAESSADLDELRRELAALRDLHAEQERHLRQTLDDSSPVRRFKPPSAAFLSPTSPDVMPLSCTVVDVVLREREAELADVREKLDVLVGERDAAFAQLTQLRDENSALRDREMELESAKVDLEQSCAELESKITSDACRIDVLLAYVDGDLRQIEACVARANGVKAEVDAEPGQRGDVVGELERCGGTLRRLRQDVEDVERRHREKCEEGEVLGGQFAALSAASKEMTRENRHVGELLAKAEGRNRALANEIAGLKSDATMAKLRNSALSIRNTSLQEAIAEFASNDWNREKLLHCRSVAKQEAVKKLEPILSRQKVLDEKIVLLRSRFDAMLANESSVSETKENLLDETVNLMTAAEEVRFDVTTDVLRFIDAHLGGSHDDGSDVDAGLQAIRSRLAAMEVRLEDFMTKFPELVVAGSLGDVSNLDDSLECPPSALECPPSDGTDVAPLRRVLDNVAAWRTAFRANLESARAVEVRRRGLATSQLEATVIEQGRRAERLAEELARMTAECGAARREAEGLRTAGQEREAEVERVKAASRKKVEDCKVEMTRMFKTSVNDYKSKSDEEISKVRRQLQEATAKHEAKVAELNASLQAVTKENAFNELGIKTHAQKIFRLEAQLAAAKTADPLVAKQRDVMAQLRQHESRQHESRQLEPRQLESRHNESRQLESRQQQDSRLDRPMRHNALRASMRSGSSSSRVHSATVTAANTTMKTEEEYTVVRRQSAATHIPSHAFRNEDEEGEVFNNTYLSDLKAGRCALPDASSLDPARLTQLQQRNSMCLPHLKSSYPAETQFAGSLKHLKEDDVKLGYNSDVENADTSSLNALLLPGERQKKRDRGKGQTYQKPGPPTPTKNGRRKSLQPRDGVASPRPLREVNEISRADTSRAKPTTPGSFRSLLGLKVKREENSPGTPRQQRLSLFKKSARNRDDV